MTMLDDRTPATVQTTPEPPWPKPGRCAGGGFSYAPGREAESVAGWFWFADADGRFRQVVATSQDRRESCRTRTVDACEPPRRPVAARESTLYPLLAGLPSNGFVETSWRKSDAGPPRRYYRLPREGELGLARFQKQWRVSVMPSTSEGSQE
jgi:Transcriptional regulator PadR-like family